MTSYEAALAAAVTEARRHPTLSVLRRLHCPCCEREIARVVKVGEGLLLVTLEYDPARTGARLELARYAERTGQRGDGWRRPAASFAYALLSHEGRPQQLLGWCPKHGSAVLT